MSAILVREAESRDDHAIGELLVEAFVLTYARKMPEVVVDDERKRELRDVAGKRARATVLVAESEGQVAGTVALFKPGAQSSEAWLPRMADLRHLAVDPSFHGRGIARALMDRAEAIARDEWKLDGICLHVRRGAHGVARFYSGRGYAREPGGDFEKPTVALEGYVLRFGQD